MKKLMMGLTLALLTTGAFASQFTVETVELLDDQIVPIGRSNGGTTGGITGTDPGPIIPGPIFPGTTGTSGFDIGLGRVGSVLSTASTAVALGEQIYTLVQHGKPSSTTEYAPISITPKDPLTKEVVNPFDLENCTNPVKRTFMSNVSMAGVVVVRFSYMVIYSYNCAYEGAGKYIQTAMIQPISVKLSYGWDFNATMKFSGMMNHGTKANPVVGALLTLKYSMNSVGQAFERNDTVHIRGDGVLKVMTN